ncbi:MAG: hypothetical protein RL514_1441 [Verrucomicrobiota bacterium]|jgi:hypothetical protein
MKTLLPLLGAFLITHLSASAQAPTTIVTFDSATVVAGTALPGSNVVVTVAFKIQPGYYLHTSRPLLPRVTPTLVQAGTLGATRSLPAAYSGPSQKTIPGSPMPLAVYEGGLTAQIAVALAPNAVFPIKLPGLISYAPVNEKTHTQGRAEQVRFEINIPRGTNALPAKAGDPKKK